MSSHYCPSCGAELLSSLFMGSWQQVECPACNEWINVDVVAPELVHRRGQDDDAAEDRYGKIEDDVDDSPPSERLDDWLDGERLVIHVLRGSNGIVRALGGALVIIVGVLSFFTWNSIWGNGDDSITAMIMLGFVWVMVGPVAAAWVFARFGSTSVMLEPTRLVIEQRLFGTCRQREYRLTLRAKASLVASNRLWGDLVYGVRINAMGEQPSFAIWLLPGEKRWIIRRINRHLRHPDWDNPQVDDNAEVTWSVMDGFQWGG